MSHMAQAGWVSLVRAGNNLSLIFILLNNEITSEFPRLSSSRLVSALSDPDRDAQAALPKGVEKRCSTDRNQVLGAHRDGKNDDSSEVDIAILREFVKKLGAVKNDEY